MALLVHGKRHAPAWQNRGVVLKRFAAFAALAVGLVALPGTASANEGCSYATGPSAGPVTLQAGPGGLDGTAATAVGACVDTGGVGAGPINFFGGAAEVGTDGGTEVYGIVDGDDRNADPSPSSQGGGYVGLSNYEDGNRPDADCDGSDDDHGAAGGDGPDTNSGNCLTIRVGPGLAVPVPLIACGNTSGKSWGGSQRDGCSIP